MERSDMAAAAFSRRDVFSGFAFAAAAAAEPAPDRRLLSMAPPAGTAPTTRFPSAHPYGPARPPFRASRSASADGGQLRLPWPSGTESPLSPIASSAPDPFRLAGSLHG